jgi:hypothetical protein
MSTTDRVLQQIDARIAAIAGNWPDESRALRCLKTAIEGLLSAIAAASPLMEEHLTICLTAICDTWEAGR